MSDCGQFGVVVIAFVGSVFSPWYHWAGRRDPENHVAVNVALYGPRGNRWAMTERGRGALKRSPGRLSVGPSTLTSADGRLEISFDEVSMPWPGAGLTPQRLAGVLKLEPQVASGQVYPLGGGTRHFWQPVAPLARIAVELDSPRRFSWQGEGYCDANWGEEPLERGFRRWDWSRGANAAGATLLYDCDDRHGYSHVLGLHFGRDGTIREFDAPPRAGLGRGFWGVERKTRCDAGKMPVHERKLEDSPFYTRSLIRTTIGGEEVPMVHETFDGDRYASRIVKAMLPFKMPRRA